MTSTLHRRDQRLVVPIASLGRADLALAGGKGANLGADSLHAWLAAALEGRATVERAGSAKGYRVLRVAPQA